MTEDGVALFDSPVICEYLDSLDGASPLFPRPGRGALEGAEIPGDGRWHHGRGGAAPGGSGRPREAARDTAMDRQKGAVDRTLDALERDPPLRALDIGSISVACALGYLDLRFAAEDWRRRAPAAGGWFAAISEEPALARTAPPPEGLSRA